MNHVISSGLLIKMKARELHKRKHHPFKLRLNTKKPLHFFAGALTNNSAN